MSRLIDYLIDQARAASENVEFGDNSGIQDSEFIQYLNDAHHRLQSVMLAQHPQVFVTESTISAVADTESYDLPSDCFLGNKVTNVEYTDSDEQNYYDLQQVGLKRRLPGVTGYPRYYIRRSGSILLQPKPQSAGTIRLNYVRRISELDKRRGSVGSVVVDSGTSTITSLTADITTDFLDTSSLNKHNYICIVDKNGVSKMKNLPVVSFNAGSGVITIDSSFTYASGETIAVGDYIVGGQDTTTHSELPRNCERYLIAYTVWKILKRDSSADYAEQQQELTAMESDIVASYSDIDDDVREIPVLNDWNWW